MLSLEILSVEKFFSNVSNTMFKMSQNYLKSYEQKSHRVKDFYGRVVADAGDVPAVRRVRIVIVVSLQHDDEDQGRQTGRHLQQVRTEPGNRVVASMRRCGV